LHTLFIGITLRAVDDCGSLATAKKRDIGNAAFIIKGGCYLPERFNLNIIAPVWRR